MPFLVWENSLLILGRCVNRRQHLSLAGYAEPVLSSCRSVASLDVVAAMASLAVEQRSASPSKYRICHSCFESLIFPRIVLALTDMRELVLSFSCLPVLFSLVVLVLMLSLRFIAARVEGGQGHRRHVLPAARGLLRVPALAEAERPHRGGRRGAQAAEQGRVDRQDDPGAEGGGITATLSKAEPRPCKEDIAWK
jgi:hypothetical protein